MFKWKKCLSGVLAGIVTFMSIPVFVNAETDQVNVVYKRKGNTYGLIEPEE